MGSPAAAAEAVLRDDRIVAHATYVTARDGTAEVAFAVADGMHELGIATTLLSQLAAVADMAGIGAFEADVLAENQHMIDVFRDSGFGAVMAHPVSGVVHLEFPTVAGRSCNGRSARATHAGAGSKRRCQSAAQGVQSLSTHETREHQMPATATNNGRTHEPISAAPPPPTDQEKFDAAVNRDGKIVLQVLGGLAIFAALLMSIAALLVSTGKSDSSGAVMAMPPAAAAAPAPATAPLVNVSVAGGNKRGPDGKMHDSFSKTDFAVKVGQPTRLRIDNKDDVPHSITSAAAGVSISVLPGVHTYTIVAKTAGRFEWMCVIPCDSGAHGWAMTHPGYMAGYITAT
jgi:hypothetical protein